MFVDGDEPIAVGAEDDRLALAKVLVAFGGRDGGCDVMGEDGAAPERLRELVRRLTRAHPPAVRRPLPPQPLVGRAIVEPGGLGVEAERGFRSETGEVSVAVARGEGFHDGSRGTNDLVGGWLVARHGRSSDRRCFQIL